MVSLHKTWLLRLNTSQCKPIVLGNPFSDIDLNIFKNKKEECYASLQKKNISQTGNLSNYILMFSFLNSYIATPLITIQPHI
jgi:hypothetical protein